MRKPQIPHMNLKIGNFSLYFRNADYIYGQHVVEAALSFNFRKSSELFINSHYKDLSTESIKRILDLAAKKDIKVKYMSKVN